MSTRPTKQRDFTTSLSCNYLYPIGLRRIRGLDQAASSALARSNSSIMSRPMRRHSGPMQPAMWGELEVGRFVQRRIGGGRRRGRHVEQGEAVAVFGEHVAQGVLVHNGAAGYLAMVDALPGVPSLDPVLPS